MSVEVIIFMTTAVILPLLLTEFGDWCPWLAKRLAQWTAQRLGDAQAAERYSEEWLAELRHLPGKLSHLLTATSYLLALPRIRWSLRAARLMTPTGPTLDELLPTRVPIYWDPRGANMNWGHQADAAYQLLRAILNDDLQVRNRMHFLVGPVGCGKTVVAHWLHEHFVRDGKKIHYVWAHAWVNRERYIHVSSRMRDRLVQASQEVDLLVVDEADQATVEALEALRLPCPILVLARSHGELGEISRLPANAGTVVNMGPILDSWLQARPNTP
ncbi:ATP-binding protein [Streptomyces sp. GF20]|uniref:ATP-binding protein n=1 Tax=Streptomyces sp. GF20 TaxID=2692235 RepID=UPI0013164BB5|nr:ATP-binding protein [Streptomyces sp. GF20]QHC19583.1 ATP-binding protein [Streptomyces sp. GF20]